MEDFAAIFAVIMGGVAVSVVLTVIFSLLIPIGVFIFIYRIMRKNREILQNGISGEATILKIWETGTFVNNRPRLGMELDVRPVSGAPYRTQTKMVVSFINLAKFQPGAVIPVRISREDPEKILFDSAGSL